MTVIANCSITVIWIMWSDLSSFLARVCALAIVNAQRPWLPWHSSIRSLRVANSFRPAPRPASEDAPSGITEEELSETWTHFLYPNPRVRSQVDWILCSQTFEASAEVVYSIDCDSDHKLLHLSLPRSPLDVVNASSTSQAQKRRRAKGCKGGQPINQEAASTFTLAMHDLPPDPCVSTIQKHLMKAVSHTSFVNAFGRKPKHSMPEPDDVSEARLALDACTDAGDRHKLARVVYRRKRRWLAALACAKFERSALSLPHPDKIGSRKMQWMWDLGGNRSYDPVKWEDSMRAHYNQLFASSLEDQETKRERLLALGTSCFADHGNGVHSWIHLPLRTLLDTRMKMQRCKAPGADGLVYEMFLLLDWDTVETLRVSFEKRFNCVNGFVEAIPGWLSVAVCTIPKDRNAHSCDKLRPLSLLGALNKCCMGCVTSLASLLVSPFTCDLFRAGHQCMEISELARPLLEKFSGWDLPMLIFKGDIPRASDNLEHPRVDLALGSKGAPTCIRAAFLRELAGISLSVQHGEASAPDVDLGKGGKQGAKEIPFLWGVTLDDVVGPMVVSWENNSYGFDLDDGMGRISHAVWADGFLLGFLQQHEADGLYGARAD